MNKTKEEIDMWNDIAVRFSQLYNRGPALLVKTQSMFPNCSKYTKCCSDDKSFWDVVEKMNKAGEVIVPEREPYTFKEIKQRKLIIPKGFANKVERGIDRQY